MEDASQIFVGAFALAVPISFSEEAWRLGEILPFRNIIMLFMLSGIFLSLFTYQSVFQRDVKSRIDVFVFRVVIAYLMVALVSATKGNNYLEKNATEALLMTQLQVQANQKKSYARGSTYCQLKKPIFSY